MSRTEIGGDWTNPRRWLGVCPELARRFGWDVWAIRLAFVVVLLLKPLLAIGAYLALAVFLPRPERDLPAVRLRSRELRDREARIAELERRFRELEREGSERR